MLAFIIVFCLPIAAFAEYNCTVLGDGIIEKGCRSYLECIGGHTHAVDCPPGQVYSNITKKCEDMSKVPPPCGLWKDCSVLKDGRYPDVDQGCHSYYTCSRGVFFGHNFCPQPLTFNSATEICDWIYNVAPPCGTKLVNTAKPGSLL